MTTPSTGPIVIVDDPQKRLAALMEELSRAIPIVYGQQAQIIVWPRDIPLHALQPAKVGEFGGLTIIAPERAARLLKRGTNHG